MSAPLGRSTRHVGVQETSSQRAGRSIVRHARSPLGIVLSLVALFGTGAGAFALADSSSGSVVASAIASATVAPSPQIPVAGGSTSGTAGYNAVSCISNSNCVSVGATSAGQGAIATTTNGGGSYTASTLPSSTPSLRAVSCVTTSICAAVGGNDLLVSSDGGQSWHGHLIADAGLDFNGVNCQSASLCLAGAIETAAGRPNAQGEIYASADGGSTWTQASTPPQVAEISAIACPTSTRCIAVGSSLLESNDSGQTWQQMPVTGGFAQLTSISCSSTQACVAVGPNPLNEVTASAPAEAVETNDGGATFHDVTFPANSALLFSVSCAGSNVCVASGAKGPGQSTPAFVASSDGGVTWAAAAPPPSVTNIAGLSCVPSGACVIVGASAGGSVSEALSVTHQWSAPVSSSP